MIILIGTICAFIIGLFFIIILVRNDCEYEKIGLFIASICLSIIIAIVLIFMAIFLLMKPFEYKNFKIKYETVKETITTPEDIRDANYTQKIIEINEEIKIQRVYVDNAWIGVFYNREISNLELLTK